MISNKLKKLYEIKQEIRESIEYISKQDVGSEFAYYPKYIKVYQNESDSLFEQYVIDGPEQSVVNDNVIEIWSTYKCVFDKDNQHLVLKEKLRDANLDDSILYIESPESETRWHDVRQVAAENQWLFNVSGYDDLIDYTTGNILINFNLSYFEREYIAPVNERATLIRKIDYSALCGTDDKRMCWYYLPNLQRIDNFVLKGDKTNLRGFLTYCYVKDLSNLTIDLKNVSNLKAGFAYSKIEKFPTFINAESVTDISELFKGRTCDSDFDLSIFSNSPISNIDEMFASAEIPENIDWSFLQGKKFKNPVIFRGIGEFDVAGIIDYIEFDNFNRLFTDQSLLKVKNIELLGKFKPTNLSNMYYGLSNNLDEIDVSWIDTSEVTTMRQMFCFSHMKVLHLGDYDIRKVEVTRTSYTGMDEFLSYTYNNLHTVTGRFIGTIKFTNNQPFDLSSTILTADSVMIFFNALDEEYTSTIKISQTTYNYLTEEQLAVATSRGWTVSVG